MPTLGKLGANPGTMMVGGAPGVGVMPVTVPVVGVTLATAVPAVGVTLPTAVPVLAPTAVTAVPVVRDPVAIAFPVCRELKVIAFPVVRDPWAIAFPVVGFTAVTAGAVVPGLRAALVKNDPPELAVTLFTAEAIVGVMPVTRAMPESG